MTTPRDQFRKILQHFDNAMLVTRSRDGEIRARPMAIAERDFDGDLWFATSRTSAKVEEMFQDRHVGVTMQGDGRWLSISGNAVLVTDRSKIEELWTPGWKAWFDGPEDPDLALIRVDAQDAEYWDNRTASGMKYMLKTAAAAITGQDVKIEETDDPKLHGKVDLA